MARSASDITALDIALERAIVGGALRALTRGATRIRAQAAKGSDGAAAAVQLQTAACLDACAADIALDIDGGGALLARAGALDPVATLPAQAAE